MRFVCISDVHCATEFDIPEGDVLLDAGDMTFTGKIPEIASAAKFRADVKASHGFKHVVCIAGNHDWLFFQGPTLARQIMADFGLIYLEDQALTIMPDRAPMELTTGPGNITIYGSPWQPWFNNWAFNLRRGDAIKQKWDLIPRAGLDILVTHGPPYGVLDGAPRSNIGAAWGSGDEDFSMYRESVGCWDLMQAVKEVKPKLHLFGHVHSAYGRAEVDGTTFINASIMDNNYDPTRKPHVFDLEVP